MKTTPRHTAANTSVGRSRRLIASLAGAALLFGSATTAAMAASNGPEGDAATLGAPETIGLEGAAEGESGDAAALFDAELDGDAAGAGDGATAGDAGGAATEEGASGEVEAPEPGADGGDEVAAGGETEAPEAAEPGAELAEGIDEAMTLEATDAEIGPLAAASVTVRAGGLRTAMSNTAGSSNTNATPGGSVASGIGGLEGVRFQLYSAQTGGTAYAGAWCVTGSDGQCTINFNNSSTVARPWVGISSTPLGYDAPISQLYGGQTVAAASGSGSNAIVGQADRGYRFQLANVVTYATQTLPFWNPWIAGEGNQSNWWSQAFTNTSGTGTPSKRATMSQQFPLQSTGYAASTLTNPPLPFWQEGGTGIVGCAPTAKVALVMDLSNSVYGSADENPTTRVRYQQAANDFIDALSTDANGDPRSNVELALFSFGTNSPRAGTQNYATPTRLTPAGVTTMKSRVNTYRESVTGNLETLPSDNGRTDFRAGSTNWDQALWKVNEAVEAGNDYDIVLFITDGDPTTWGSGTSLGAGPGTGWPGTNPFVNAIDPNFRNVEYGVYSVNALKNNGVRVNVVGVGNPGVIGQYARDTNLSAISGPTKYTNQSSLARVDYAAPSWTGLSQLLRSWADDVIPPQCDAWVTVQKETKAFDATTFTPAAGWTFDLAKGTVPNGTTLTPTGTTQQTAGTDASFTWKYTFPTTDSVASGIKLAETAAPTGDQLASWQLSKVVCTAEGGAPIESTLADLQASIGPDLKVGDHYTCTFSNEQAGVKMNKYWTVDGIDYPVNQMPTVLDTTWNATATLTPAPTKPDETVAWGKDMGLYKTGDKVQVGETSVTEVARNLPGCKLTKSEIKGPGIGEAYVPLTVTDGTGSVEGTLAAGQNVYDLHNVVTCEQELTLIKQVDNVEGGVAEPVSAPGDWTLTAQKGTDAAAINESPATTVPAVPARADSAAAKTQTVKVPVGDYALTEAFGPDVTSTADGTAYQQQAQWACVVTKTDGTTDTKAVTGTMPAASVNVGTGESVTCRVVNETAELTVLKKVVGGSAQPSDWTLTATPETADLAGIEAPGAFQPLGTTTDKNTILVKPGEKYTLTESEGSAAYFQTAFQKYTPSEDCSAVEIDQDNAACWTDADADDVSVEALDRGIYRFVNTYVESPSLPQTGGQGAAFFAILGGGLLLGAGGLAALSRRRRAEA